MNRCLGLVLVALIGMGGSAFAAMPDVGGLVQVEYADRRGADACFDVKAARLSLDAGLTDRISMRLQLDASRQPELLEAKITYSWSRYANITVGQFKIPFGFETLLSRYDLETIRRSLVVSSFLDNGVSAPYLRDVGLMVEGRYKLFQYKVAAVNGTGYNYHRDDPDGNGFLTAWSVDNNNSKDIVGWVGMGIPMFAGLGFSFYEGEWPDGGDRNARGFDLHFDTGKIIFQYEYLRGFGLIDDLEFLCNKYSGYYWLVGYRVIPMIQPTFKVDRYDPNWDVGDDKLKDYYWGVTVNWERKARLQVFYRESKEAGEFRDRIWLVQTSARL